MNNNMTGFQMVFEYLCVPVLWTNVASAFEGLRLPSIEVIDFPLEHTQLVNVLNTQTVAELLLEYCYCTATTAAATTAATAADTFPADN